MTLKKDEIISAQVVLRPASGKSSAGQTAITSQNIRDFVPSSENIARARKAFMEKGFDVGHVVGNSFSITGSVGTFEQVFKAGLHREVRGGIKALRSEISESFELPLKGLPEEIAELVESVTFTAPPDFGPSNF